MFWCKEQIIYNGMSQAMLGFFNPVHWSSNIATFRLGRIKLVDLQWMWFMQVGLGWPTPGVGWGYVTHFKMGWTRVGVQPIEALVDPLDLAHFHPYYTVGE